MKTYNAPYSDETLLTDTSESSLPGGGPNEGEVIPWALDW